MATSTRASKSKGYRGETEFVEACAEWGHEVERNGNRYGSKDRGDASGLPDWTVQIKSVERISIPEWLRDVEVQAKNNGNTRWRGIALKLRGKHMRDGVMILPMSQFFQLIRHVDVLERFREAQRIIDSAEEGADG